MSYRFRLYPTAVDEVVLRGHCEQARAVWNTALEHANYHRPWTRAGLDTPGLAVWDRQLAEARQTFDWLAAGSSSVQQAALRDLRQAFRNWWTRPDHFGRPAWRKAGVHEGFVIRDLTVVKINRRWATVVVPKLGAVRFRLTRRFAMLAGCKSARVTLDRAGRWHVAFTAPQPDVERSTTGAIVGLDMGVAATVTTSDGEHLRMPELLSPGERQRLRRLQRRLARQEKGSNRRERIKCAVGRLKAREADRRKEWIEQTTTTLVRGHDLIAVEDLKVRNMVRSAKGTLDEPGRRVAQKRGLNRSIHTQAWSMFRRRLEQKAAATPSDHQCVVIAVNPANTSRRCARCGHTTAENRESQTVFACRACNHRANADVNAAVNILAAGRAVTGRGGTPHRAAPETSGRPGTRRNVNQPTVAA